MTTTARSTTRIGRRLPASVLPVLLAAAAACSDGTNPLTEADVVGHYTANRFLAVQGTDTMDILAAGGTVTLDLASDHTTTGQLFAPPEFAGGQDYTVDLRGTWGFLGTTVYLVHQPDTFLTAMRFSRTSENHLEAEHTYTGTVIVVGLDRAP
jgi:hypothetical protein